MSFLIQTLLNTGKAYTFRNQISSTISLCKCTFRRKYSLDVPRKFVTFDEVVELRRAEARRSLVVQVNSESSFTELYKYCTKYADVKGIHHYKNPGGEHFMLIEFETEDNLKDIVHHCTSHQKDPDVMAIQSPFLWFRASQNKETSGKCTKSLEVKDGNVTLGEDVLFDELLKCESISDQIQMLYDKTMLNDLGIRLRYLVARQLEIIFKSLYANVVVRPFGSSVNGFGKMGCDLDLVLSNQLSDDMIDSTKRLVYQEKKCESGRNPWQRHMELVGDIVELKVAGAVRVQRILHARVPIVKYAHEHTGVDCDLCYSNMSGVHMSELLWLCGSLDARVRPLTLAVRRWALAAGLTSAHPGRWITNFPLTLMVLFFLQNVKDGPILPPFNNLVKRARKEDYRIVDDSVNCTFLRDMSLLPEDCYGQNQLNLETLLLQFFEFYAQFDFQNKAISLNEGTPVRKPNALPLYVVNPLEQALNVSRNVSFEEAERLRLEVRNAAWQLEAGLEGQKTDEWGLLGLIEKRSTRSLKKLLRVGNSHRLVSVKDLFNESNDPAADGIRSKLEKMVRKTDDGVKERKDKIKFKNSQVASEVYRIRRNKLV